MKSSGNDAAARFGARLRKLMLQAGHASRGSRSGVDVARLAEMSGASYEMARRYAEGLAMPRPEKLEAIAKWLGIKAAALAYGEGSTTKTEIDEGVLRWCIQSVNEAQTRTGRKLTTEQAARLVALLYREASTERKPATESLDLMVRAVAT